MQLKRKLHLKSPHPKSLYEQGTFFRDAVRSKNCEKPWKSSVILFPQQWVDLIKNDTIDLNLKILIPTILNNVDIYETVPHSSNISPTSILIMDNVSNAIIIEEI